MILNKTKYINIIRYIIISFTVFLIAGSMSGCGNKNELVGQWMYIGKNITDTERYEFKNDGTFMHKKGVNNNPIETGKYKLSEDKLTLTLTYNNGIESVHNLEIKKGVLEIDGKLFNTREFIESISGK